LSLTDFENSIKLVQDNEDEVNNKYLTEKNIIEKNSKLSFGKIQKDFFLVQRIDKTISSVNEIKVFGKK
jgi:hypothetical protein